MYLMHFIKTIKEYATTKGLIAEFSYPLGLNIENPYVVTFKHMDTGETFVSYAVDYTTFDSHARTDYIINELVKRIEQDLSSVDEDDSEDTPNDIFVWLCENIHKEAEERHYTAWTSMRGDGVMTIKFVPRHVAKSEYYEIDLMSVTSIDDARMTLHDMFEDLLNRTLCSCNQPWRCGVPYRRYQ